VKPRATTRAAGVLELRMGRNLGIRLVGGAVVPTRSRRDSRRPTRGGRAHPMYRAISAAGEPKCVGPDAKRSGPGGIEGGPGTVGKWRARERRDGGPSGLPLRG